MLTYTKYDDHDLGHDKLAVKIFLHNSPCFQEKLRTDSIYSLREVMLLGTDDLGASGFDQYFGHGRLNVRTAVEAAKAYAPVLDTTPPTVAITSPTNGATISSATYITVTATDNRDISKIEVFDNEQLLGTVSGAQGSVYWPAPQGGSHVLKATTWDAAGNSASASISVSVPVDTQAPVVTLSQPMSGSSITKLRKVSIQASATDNRGVASMELLIDGKSISSVAASSLSYTWNVSKVASGSYVIRVKACDAALNCAAVEVSVVK